MRVITITPGNVACPAASSASMNAKNERVFKQFRVSFAGMCFCCHCNTGCEIFSRMLHAAAEAKKMAAPPGLIQ